MLKYTATTLKKLENLFKQLAFKIRYEKGNFQAGHCVVQQKRIIVINKFYTTEARIQCLIEILMRQNVETDSLEEESKDFYNLVVAYQANVTK